MDRDFFWPLSAPTWHTSCYLPPLGRATPSVFWMSLDDSSPLLESTLPWAWYIARKSSRGRAALFPALGQGSFRGPTPMEFDKYSKALYPPSYQILEPKEKGGSPVTSLWNSSSGSSSYLEFVKVVDPAKRCSALLEDLLSFSYVAEL
ncbi:hypothetical protein HID58_013448 [Brassica napus]|uniref:Uncharacterized protein n=1 Tax=Brassica napus TaxID=3708 RepID=A0ABQ8E3X3_BRANA|nr:hypothetical protein HID58_013448 [Brassica napus]